MKVEHVGGCNSLCDGNSHYLVAPTVPRRAHCWHPWRRRHTHPGVGGWRCRGCCGCEEGEG